MEENKSAIEEYKFLREEIMHHKKRQNTFTAFSYTTIVALWGYAIERENPWITIIALVLTLPTSFRVFESRQAISQLSAYMQVYLEPITGFRWETMLFEYRSLNHTKSKERLLYFVSKWDYIFLTSASIGLFWVMVIVYERNLKPLFFHIVLFLDIFMFLAEIAVTFYCFDYERLTSSKKDKWKKVYKSFSSKKTEKSVLSNGFKCKECGYWCPCKGDKTNGVCFYNGYTRKQTGTCEPCNNFEIRTGELKWYLVDDKNTQNQ